MFHKYRRRLVREAYNHYTLHRVRCTLFLPFTNVLQAIVFEGVSGSPLSLVPPLAVLNWRGYLLALEPLRLPAAPDLTHQPLGRVVVFVGDALF